MEVWKCTTLKNKLKDEYITNIIISIDYEQMCAYE